MRILVVGAGAIGGYFGGRLLQAGRDVTFLVRPRRAAQLAASGLMIRSPSGDIDIANPPTVQAEDLHGAYDLILLSCKAYDLDEAIESFAPAVGHGTSILPLLNGMRHLDALETKFGRHAVLGGQCYISAALDADGRIQHLNPNHSVSFGELDGGRSPRVDAIHRELSGTGFDALLSEAILQDMWEKWIFIASMAGVTCLMRASVGDILTANGPALATSMLSECAEIAAGAGFAPRPESLNRGQAVLTAAGSPLMASMLRDIERGAQTEGEHILGDLVRRRKGATPNHSLLELAHAHVRAYEARRAREAAAATR